jgi:hypothetical protein
LEDAETRLDGEWTGALIGLSIDARGNVLATWDTDLRARRYIDGVGWQTVERPYDISVNQYYMWAAGAPDGSVLVATNAIRNGTNYAPWVVHFE